MPAGVPGDPPPLELELPPLEELPPPDEELLLLVMPLGELSPPQLPRPKAHSNSTMQRVSGGREVSPRIERGRLSTANGSRMPANTTPPFAQGANRLAVAAVVLIVSVSVMALPVTVALAGENVQLAPLGRPEQLNATLALNPPLGVSVSVVVADFPGATVAAALDAVSAKEGADDVAPEY